VPGLSNVTDHGEGKGTRSLVPLSFRSSHTPNYFFALAAGAPVGQNSALMLPGLARH
jgi:hypothetical protein